MKSLNSIWPKIPAPFVRAMLAGHSALGLAFAALIYVVCLTGSIVVLANEMQRWERPQIAPVERVEPAAIEALTQNILARYDHVEHLYVNLPDRERLPRFTAYVDIADTLEDPEITADAEGRIVEAGEAPFTHFLTRLHINLHLPQTWGVFIVALTGVALLSSLVSGIFAHPRAFRDAFYLRWGGAKRLQEADLHNRIGIWGLPFHVIISLTGALIGLTTIIVGFLAFALFQGDMDRAYALFLPPTPIDDPRPAPLPQLDPMVAEIARIAPGAEIAQVLYEHPGEAGQAVMIYATRPQQLSFGDSFTFNGASELTHSEVLQDSSLGVKVLQAISTLHFGWFGGWAIKISYLLLGLGLTAVTSSGVAIWLARRRDKGRPAPMWERIWIATVWSQPFAYAACALIAVLGLSLPLVPAWGVLTIACATLLVMPPMSISRVLRGATALLLLGAAGAHIAQNSARFADPLAWWFDGAIIATALVLFATLVSHGQQSAKSPIAEHTA